MPFPASYSVTGFARGPWKKCRLPARKFQEQYDLRAAMEQHDRDEEDFEVFSRRSPLQRLRCAIVNLPQHLTIFNCCRIGESTSEETFRRPRVQEARLLVLGASDTGKSTFMKQMRYVFGDTYPTEDRRRHLPFIRRNLLESLHKMVRAMENFGIAHGSRQAQEAARRFSDMEPLEEFLQENATVDPLLLEQTQVLWADSGVREVYRRGNEYHLLTNAEHFITNAENILADEYLPTMDDILRMRYPTRGSLTITYDLGEMRMTLHDMGGQRSERQDWINQLNNPTAILFLASLSEYDQTVEEATEDPDKNRVQESLDIFQELLCYPPFVNTPIILLLNKADVFREKIAYHSLQDYFPEYTGAENNEVSGREFIAGMYEELASRFGRRGRHFVARFTEATNTENFVAIFSYIRSHVSRSMIGQAGLY